MNGVRWWADYLDANRDSYISPFDFAKVITSTINSNIYDDSYIVPSIPLWIYILFI